MTENTVFKKLIWLLPLILAILCFVYSGVIYGTHSGTASFLLWIGLGVLFLLWMVLIKMQLARKKGYEIHEVPYGNFPAGVKGNAEKMMQAFFSALEQAEEILKEVCWENYTQILFVSKSIGTAVAGAYAQQHALETRNIFFTPVEQTFQCISQEGIVFHGTSDPWAETELVEKECDAMNLPLYKVVGANHSLETEDAIENIHNLGRVMDIVNRYI